MALSGSIATGAYKCDDGTTRSVVLQWTATQDISTNTSTINWSLVGGGTRAGSKYVKVFEVKVVIDGVEVYYRNSSSSNGTPCYLNEILLDKDGNNVSGSTSVAHNSDGTKSLTISVYAGIYAHAINQEGSQTIALDIIPRTSAITMSASNLTVGGACNVKWTPASASFKYRIQLALNNWSVTLPSSTTYISPNQTTEYTYNIGTTINNNRSNIYAQLPSSTSGTMTVTLTTYDASNNVVGSSASATFTVIIPSSVMPTVGTITLTPQTYSYLIQGQNKLMISVANCTAGIGSSIKSYTFSGVGISSTTTATSVTSAQNISPSGTTDQVLTYTVMVTDTRGRSTSKSATITCYAYSAPSITSFTAYRSDYYGSATDSGAYLWCSYSLAYSLNTKNSITLKIYYKSSAATSYTLTTVLNNQTGTSSGTYSGSTKIYIGATSGTYSAYAIITDKYGGSSSSAQSTAFSGDRILNISSDGKGIAFGTTASGGNLLESGWPVEFYDTLEVDKDATFNGAITATNDIKTTSGSMSCKNITASGNITATSGKLTCKDVEISGALSMQDVNCGKITASGNITTSGNIETKGGEVICNTLDAASSIATAAISATGMVAGGYGSFNTIILSTDNENFFIPEIQFGKIKVQPSSANSLKSVTITFDKIFSGKPIVFVNAGDNIAAVTRLYGQATSSTQAKIYINQTNTSATVVYWMALYSTTMQDDTSTTVTAS